ncbi:hypothetical protein UZ36_07255 [Candidatus Nitromaritima sp. SCGC AAA799-C22]|nr:hypothetical protein UZ36_07255 [Candidatus Nitromaritima sp. SCGC AAA799-C22]
MRKSAEFSLTVILAFFVMIAAPTVGFGQQTPAGGEQNGPKADIKMQGGDQVVEQVNVIDEMIGNIDWENNVVYAVGDGVPPKDAISPAQARVRSKRAAIDEGYGRLLEMVNQVRVDAESLTRNFVNENRVVRTKVSGLVKNAEIMKLRHFEDGSFQIKMKMPLLGAGGLSSAVYPVHAENVRKVGIAHEVSREGSIPAKSTPPKVKKSGQSSLNKTETEATYTGLIIDARGLNGKPSLYPKILSANGKVVYDITIADPNATIEEGLTAYRKSLDAAKSLKRLGSNPLVVKASKISGKYQADFVVSKEDTERILAANAQENFLNDAKVAVVLE